MTNRSKLIVIIFLAIITSLLCLGYGSVNIPSNISLKVVANKITGTDIFPVIWKKSTANIVWNIRAPRVILAFVTGASLSIVGLIMQTITKNNLAEPYILGISSGASTGAVAVIVLSNTYTFLKLITIEQGAFIGAFISIVIVFFINSKQFFNKNSLILTGVGVSAFFMACTNVIIYSSKNNSQLVTAMFWMTGSLSSASWENIAYPAIVLVVMLLALLLYSYELDILLMGEINARTLGVNIKWIKLFLILLSTLLVSLVVSVTGIIGFIGLVVPHIARKLVGYKHRNVTLFSTFIGGIFLVISDTVARSYFSPEEMPIGVITAFCGTPLFLWIIRKDYMMEGKK